MIYCITVTCHTNAAKQKARDSKTTWRHRTLRSVDSPCEAQHEGSIWRSVLVNYTQMGIDYAVSGISCYKMFVILPRTTVLRRYKCYTWKTDVQQRAHWLVVCYSSCRSYRKYFVAEQWVHCTPLHYNSGGMQWILLTILIKPFFYERFLDWHNTRFNGLTHIFLDLWGDCYWLPKICHM